MRRKNEKYAERNFLFQQCPEALKRESIQKIEWGIKYWPRINSL